MKNALDSKTKRLHQNMERELKDNLETEVSFFFGTKTREKKIIFFSCHPPTATSTITFALVHSAASTALASHGFVYAPNAP